MLLGDRVSLLTHADFGCGDGDHRAWIIVEGQQDGSDEHASVAAESQRGSSGLPSSLDELDTLIGQHGGRP